MRDLDRGYFAALNANGLVHRLAHYETPGGFRHIDGKVATRCGLSTRYMDLVVPKYLDDRQVRECGNCYRGYNWRPRPRGEL